MTGIRVTELALLEVADVLYPSGAIKPEVYLRADITKGCRPRNIYLTHAKCLAALDAWFADEYRGFRPGSKLVMTHKGQAFELAFKHRQLDSGPEVYRACDALQQTISRLYRQAGIKHGSSHSGRRSLAAKVLAATGDVEAVQTILGHACLDHSKPYLSIDQGIEVEGKDRTRYTQAQPSKRWAAAVKESRFSRPVNGKEFTDGSAASHEIA